MNILLTDDGLDWTPRQDRLLSTAQTLSAHGYGVAVVCPGRAILKRRAFEARLPAFDLDFAKLRRFDAARQLRTLERRANVDLVHVHGRCDARACLPLQLTGTPVVRSCDDGQGFIASKFWRQACRRVIAENPATRQALIEHGLSESRIDLLDDSDMKQRLEALLAIYVRAIGS